LWVIGLSRAKTKLLAFISRFDFAPRIGGNITTEASNALC